MAREHGVTDGRRRVAPGYDLPVIEPTDSASLAAAGQAQAPAPAEAEAPAAAPASIPAAHMQAKYQVRLDWGVDGAAAIARDADVVVWVDVLPPVGPHEEAPTPAATTPTDTTTPIPGTGAVLAGGLTDASAVAAWVLDEQVRLGRRAMVALVAAGDRTASGSPRFAVEDFLAAGAIVDALARLGIDYCSPEAAAASAAFTGLRGAVAHLLTASVSGQEHIAAGSSPAEIAPAGRLDSVPGVNVLRAATAAE